MLSFYGSLQVGVTAQAASKPIMYEKTPINTIKNIYYLQAMRSKLIVAFCSTATNQNGRFCKKSLEAAGI